jgi:glycosyltransferase involved in cell wall biosynthesis
MVEKKKILFIVEAMAGGVFTYMVDLANKLVNEYDMYIAYAVRPQTPTNFREYFDKRIRLIKVENFNRAINPVKDVKAFFEIKKIVREVSPDIIHLHSSKAGTLGRWAFNGEKIPIFYTPHGYSFLMQNCSSVKRMMFKAIEAASGKRNCTTISCSQGEHLATLKLTKDSTCVSNGINTDELQSLIDSVGNTEKHVFTVFTLGRICYQKNPALFNQVAEALPKVRFLWIGDGELREELKAPNIEITGWVERKEALRRSLCGDVFLLTSLWEGLPISLLEAMYMKKVCIVSDVIGNRDVIHNEKNGYVCRKTDEFIHAIKETQTSDVTALINRAYQDIMDEYNTNVMTEKYSEIYMNKLRTIRGGQREVIFIAVCCESTVREAVAA